MSRIHRVTLLVATVATLSVVVPAASAAQPDDVLQRAREAVEIGRTKAQGLAQEAQGLAEEAPGQDDRARGLDRAAEALEAAAARKAARAQATADGERPGRGLGRGHSAEVHAILLEGGSPSAMPPHGQTVSAMANAFETIKADHPGLGLGRDNPGTGDGGGD